jgi:hypothetical protein
MVRNEISDILGSRELWFSGKQRFWPKRQNPEKGVPGHFCLGVERVLSPQKQGF